MKYILLGLGVYLIYRFYFNKPANLSEGDQRDFFENEPTRKAEKSEAEDFIDYEELD